METIRVFIADLPVMLRDIVGRLISAADDMEVAGYGLKDRDLVESVVSSEADVVVLGCADARLSDSGARLLDSRPCLKVVAIAGDGKRASLYELRPHRRAIGEVSPESLIERIRMAMNKDVAGSPAEIT